MKPQQRAFGILLQMAGWSGAAIMFYRIRFQGLGSAAACRVSAFPQIDPAFVVRNLMILVALLGLAYGVLDIFLDRPRLRHLPYLCSG